ncbi:MAG: bacillithiol biosynthesis cysteine-adding enzyme BshC [Bacteroidetes bacterium]|nr:bacillithiol biosynthesis cysteine-adding enzyme BshC [Rhodothermia bacterium]MCX7906687.1 bacillithiol biosynthesis cysteine-adding enzyme BshC [Bacteroidota bacterium]MDW8137033.1 bacillithiol biosynthesis cysteine-adding enzyme BshC [Bacteroidota bacterium]MDW8285096.1 bacillithiol biosynthesis cysteine-adding enzyme BshC [Bacteroidota bacterium]
MEGFSTTHIEEACSWQAIPSNTLFRAYLRAEQSLRALWLGPHYADWRAGGFAVPQDGRRAHLRALSEVLLAQVRRLGGDAQAQSAARVLAHPEALAVVTGQQVGLLGGPLYTFYKILTALQLRQAVQERHPDRPVVAVFWLEGEDHDLREVNQLAWPADGTLMRAHLELKEERPIAMCARLLPEEISDWLGALWSRLPDTPYAGPVRSQLEAAYQPGRSWSEAFARLLYGLFADTGLVLLDPADPALKRLWEEFFVRVLREWPQVFRSLREQSERLSAQGYELPLRPRPIGLFWMEPDGERRALEPEPDARVRWRGTDRSWTQAELLDRVRIEPERISPGVALRPLAQDWLLPTVAYVAGPAEVAYWAQVLALYPHFGLRPPVVWPRLSATLLDPAALRLLERLGLRFVELFERAELLQERLLARYAPLSVPFSAARAAIEAGLEQLLAPVRELDPTLEGAWGRTRARILQELEALEVRTRRAQRRRHAELLAQLLRLLSHVAPEGELQERVWSTAYALLRWGPESLRERLTEHALNPDRHHLVRMP